MTIPIRSFRRYRRSKLQGSGLSGDQGALEFDRARLNWFRSANSPTIRDGIPIMLPEEAGRSTEVIDHAPSRI